MNEHEKWVKKEKAMLKKAKEIYNKCNACFNPNIDLDSVGDGIYDLMCEECWEKFRKEEKKINEQLICKKIKLFGLGSEGKKSYYVFDKQLTFFAFLSAFLEKLHIEKPGSLYEYEDNSLNLEDVTDTFEQVANDKYEIDIFYGQKRIIVVIRSDQGRDSYLDLMKEFVEFKGF